MRGTSAVRLLSLIALTTVGACSSAGSSHRAPAPGTTSAPPSTVAVAVTTDLAPTGKLRVAVNVGNVVLARRGPDGQLSGVAVDLGQELARRIGVPFGAVEYAGVPEEFAGLKAGAWDVAFLAIDPARADSVDFTDPYMLVPNTYAVAQASALTSVAEVDKPGVRVGVVKGFANDLYLSRTLKQAAIVRADTLAAEEALLVAGSIDAASFNRDGLLAFTSKTAGYRVLDDSYQDVKHAIAVPKGHGAGLSYVQDFVKSIKANGDVSGALQKNGLVGERVATG
ncbi:MAG: transporter substrate-binding domain-containing protein [Acidimicrobiales bacterium]